MIQSATGLIKIRELSGAVTLSPDISFAIESWFEGTYQEGKEKYLNDNFGFRPWFIKINNQIQYSLFNNPKANQIIIGKNGFLFEENYIKAHYGNDFVGEDEITEKIRKLKFISTQLKLMNKELVIILAPGKASYFPEYIPKSMVQEKGKTNFDFYLKSLNENKINFIDFHTFFNSIKSTTPYPLYPKYGIHWSTYGMYLAADSMISYLSKLTNAKIPGFSIISYEISEAIGMDCDIATGMNLIFHPGRDVLCYPKVKFEFDTNAYRPRLVSIADSYYWSIYNNVSPLVFNDNKFWFYNKEIYPDTYSNPKYTDEIDLANEIQKTDIFIILSTDATLSNLGWGFIENMYQTLSNNESLDESRINDIITYIKSDQNWYQTIVEKAKYKNKRIEHVLREDAIWMLENKR